MQALSRKIKSGFHTITILAILPLIYGINKWQKNETELNRILGRITFLSLQNPCHDPQKRTWDRNGSLACLNEDWIKSNPSFSRPPLYFVQWPLGSYFNFPVHGILWAFLQGHNIIQSNLWSRLFCWKTLLFGRGRHCIVLGIENAVGMSSPAPNKQ